MSSTQYDLGVVFDDRHDCILIQRFTHLIAPVTSKPSTFSFLTNSTCARAMRDVEATQRKVRSHVSEGYKTRVTPFVVALAQVIGTMQKCSISAYELRWLQSSVKTQESTHLLLSERNRKPWPIRRRSCAIDRALLMITHRPQFAWNRQKIDVNALAESKLQSESRCFQNLAFTCVCV